MGDERERSAAHYVENLRKSGLTIYDSIKVGDRNLWIPTATLETLLDEELQGVSLTGLPLRTRSKVIKEHICRVLGYPVPNSFKKSKPRFPGQLFDTYVQKSNNLQIWNEELSPTRRYVLIRISETDEVTRVKVVSGDRLTLLDTTGTLTQKYQARCVPGSQTAELVTPQDTFQLRLLTSEDLDLSLFGSPSDDPRRGELLSIRSLFNSLSRLLGKSFADQGNDQERNRGAELHRQVCECLGYRNYQDDGQFPDVRHQLLEVKLQTSPTIDLGLVLPSSNEPLGIPLIDDVQVHHCDVRYAVFYATNKNGRITLRNLLLTTGEAFFSRFSQFQGKVLNKKLQIPLPNGFFDR